MGRNGQMEGRGGMRPQWGTHLLLEEALGTTADGQQRRVVQCLADSEVAQQSVALWGGTCQHLPRCPPNLPTPAGGPGCGHLQDVGEAVLELLPVQLLAVHEHLPKQGPCAPQPPGHGVQQRGFPWAWEATREGLEKAMHEASQELPKTLGEPVVQPWLALPLASWARLLAGMSPSSLSPFNERGWAVSLLQVWAGGALSAPLFSFKAAWGWKRKHRIRLKWKPWLLEAFGF